MRSRAGLCAGLGSLARTSARREGPWWLMRRCVLAECWKWAPLLFLNQLLWAIMSDIRLSTRVSEKSLELGWPVAVALMRGGIFGHAISFASYVSRSQRGTISPQTARQNAHLSGARHSRESRGAQFSKEMFYSFLVMGDLALREWKQRREGWVKAFLEAATEKRVLGPHTLSFPSSALQVQLNP